MADDDKEGRDKTKQELHVPIIWTRIFVQTIFLSYNMLQRTFSIPTAYLYEHKHSTYVYIACSNA